MRVVHRPATSDDNAFVISNWLHGIRDSRDAGAIPSRDFFPIMWPVIGRLLERPGVRTIVACEAREPSLVYGFIAGDTTGPQPVVHYVYVKGPFRRAGYARGLFRALGVDPERPFRYGFRTFWCHDLATKIPAGRWDPSVARNESLTRRTT